MWVILNCGTILNETLILANGGPVEGTLAAVTDKPLSPRGFFPVHLTSEMVGSSPSSSDPGCRPIHPVVLPSAAVHRVGGFHEPDLEMVPLDVSPCLAARGAGDVV